MRLFQRKRKTSLPSSPHKSHDLGQKFPDFPVANLRIIEEVTPFTMTSPERIAALCDAVDYLTRFNIRGDFVECGVWRGGSVLAAIRKLQQQNQRQREIWLYDTFEGMTPPTSADVDFLGQDALTLLSHTDRNDPASVWCCSQLEEVQSLLIGSGYPAEQIHFIQGAVERTIPQHLPEQIALLRLDTDWYESTKHELIHLIPRMAPGGVLIIDDYGHWEGCRRAVDEYFENFPVPVLLQRIDYTGRLAVIPNLAGKRTTDR
jgi:O-methyltransferase